MPKRSTCCRREIEREQLDAGLLAVVGFADDADEFVEIGQRDEIAFEISARSSALRNSKRVRRMTTSRRCSM